MSVCVVCNNPLEVEIERDEDEEYDNGASSSSKAPAAAPETVPDDVQMKCGCHFHWLAIIAGVCTTISDLGIAGTVFSKPTRPQSVQTAGKTSHPTPRPAHNKFSAI